MTAVACALLILASAEPVHPAGRFVDDFHQALRSGAGEKVLQMLAPEVVIFESGEAEMTREEYASHHLGADMEFSKATTSAVDHRQVIDLAGGAVVLSRTTTTGTFRDRPVASRGVETMVLERTGEAWRIRHIHWSSGPLEADEAAAPELTSRRLAARLREAGLKVGERPPVEQPFFTRRADIFVVGEDEMQVFEFASAAEAEKAAASVSAEGTTIGTSSMHWMAPPHFYRSGRLVVLHLGSNAPLQSALGKILGASFAGKR